MASSRWWLTLALGPLALGTCVLLVPMPHGGTFGGNLLESWFRGAQWGAELQEQRRVEPAPPAPPRFAGQLSFVARASAQGWAAGSVGLRSAWLHEASGTIWGERERLSFKRHLLDREDIVEAVSHCRSVAPAGYWSLPTGEEIEQARRAHITDHVPDLAGRWMVQSFVKTVVAPAFVAIGPDDGGHIAVRCLARQSTSSR